MAAESGAKPRIVRKAHKVVRTFVRLMGAESGAIGAEKGRVKSSLGGRADYVQLIRVWLLNEMRM